MSNKKARRRERREQEQQARVTTVARRNQLASESWRVFDQEIVDRNDYLPTAFGFQSRHLGYAGFDTRLTDREHGKNAPFVEDELDANHVRGLARMICNEICPGLGIVENLKGAIVGKGFTFRAKKKRYADPDRRLLARVQYVIDRHLELNQFQCSLDRELLVRARRDGEYVLAHHGRPDGSVWLRQVEPEQVNEPHAGYFDNADLNRVYNANINCATDWSFGVQTAENDVQRVFGYAVQWPEDRSYTYYPASMVVHQKQNVDRNIKRGLSDFYPAWKWLKQQAALLENTGEGAKKLAAISYIIQYAQATSGDVNAMRRNKADTEFTTRTPGGGTKTTYREDKMPGSVLNVPLGQEYLAGPMGAERGQAFLDVVQGVLRQVATRWCMTEGMISGDDSNNNMASSVEAGGRWYNYVEGSQGELAQGFVASCWMAVYHAYRCGQFAGFGMSFEEIKQAVAIEATPPQIDKRQTLELEQVRDLRHNAGVLTKERWQAEVGIETDEAEQGENVNSLETGAGTGELGVDGGNGVDVAKQALNGAQVTSMQEIITNAAAGAIPLAAVKPMMLAAFPTADPALIDAMVKSLEGFKPTATADGKPIEQAGPAQTGEYANASRLQWRRNLSSIKEILAGLKSGEITPAFAKDALGMAGVNDERADRLIADVTDNGTVDDPELAAMAESAVRELMAAARLTWSTFDYP